MLQDLRRQLRAERKGADRASDVVGDCAVGDESDHVAVAADAIATPAPTTTTDALAAEPLSADLLAAIEVARESQPRLHASLCTLDAHQLRAVLAEDPAALVRAQVGSGKTAVLVHKVLWLHLVRGVPLRDMAVLTFTHKAAAEIRTRVEALADFGTDGLARSFADFWLFGTFHGVARALLQRALPIARIGYRQGFHVLDEHARDALWRGLIATHALKIKYVARLPWRMTQLRLGQVRCGAMKADDDLVRLADLARAEKVRLQAMDFDDLIAHATDLLQPDGSDALPIPKWLIVDEFQDCEPRELALLKALRGPPGASPARLFAVGDPHQVIYAWRGSTPQLFRDVERDFACVPYALPVNYRSTQTILLAARAVLGLQPASARDATPERLQPTRGPGTAIVIRKHHDPFHEAMYLSGRLRQLHQGGMPWREMAILVRTRRQCAVLREVLVGQGLPVLETARAGLHDHPAATWLLGLLRVALQPGTAAGLRETLTHPHYGGLPLRLWNLKAFAKFEAAEPQQRALATIRAFLAARKPGDATARRDLTDAVAFCDQLLTLPDALAGAMDGDLETLVLRHIDLAARLRPTSARHPQDLADARRLLRALQAWCAAEGETLAAGLARAVDEVALGGMTALREAADPQADAVRLMTLHASKGLEFLQVFISGVNHGVLPLTGAWAAGKSDPEGEAEERRLLFVGLTRARDGVELSYHTQAVHAQALGLPSPYLYLIPAALADWQDGTAPVAPPAATTLAADPDPAAPWVPDMAVRHPRYGVGTVLRVDIDTVFCEFKKFGERSFAIRLCPLTAA